MTLKALGIGGDDVATITESSGVTYADGKFSVDTSVLTEEKPNAWIRVYPNDIDQDAVDSWHWGLFADATSTTDIWGGIFTGDTLLNCGNCIGLNTTDLVDGRVLKMWTVTDGEVTYSVSAEIELL